MIKELSPPPNRGKSPPAGVELTKKHSSWLATNKRLGKNHAYLQQYIKRGVPPYLQRCATMLAAGLRTDVYLCTLANAEDECPRLSPGRWAPYLPSSRTH